jgi:S1-C subfamily serine protease
MNAFHARALTLLALLAGAAHAADAPPAPPAPAAPSVPASPVAPATPDAWVDSDRRERDADRREQESEKRQQEAEKREQARMDRELQRAQEELNRAAREVAELSTKMREQDWSAFEPNVIVRFQRSMLGINIGHAVSDEPTDGVLVLSVSPGGPAEQAGLKAKDVILSVGGKELHGDKKTSAQEVLLGQMRHTPPGTPVALEYRRDGKVSKVQVTPKSMGDVFGTPFANSLTTAMSTLKSMNRGVLWMDGTVGFGSAELADLSPGLGHYFGTDKGLLVVRAPKDDRLKLQDGDVILDIDGRVPGSPSHAYEILGSYRGGESLKLHVMRQQKRLELPIEIPEDAHPGMSRLRADGGFNRFDLISPNRLPGL